MRRCCRTIHGFGITFCSTNIFHGDTGRGLGASHQTGWTGLVALLLHGREEDDPTRMDMPTGEV